VSPSAQTANPPSTGCSSACAAAHYRGPAAARRVPVVYLVFDVLWLDGRLVTGLPLVERRGLLEGLGLASTPAADPAAGVEQLGVVP
jgi:ATP-dependent DNA ligase